MKDSTVEKTSSDYFISKVVEFHRKKIFFLVPIVPFLLLIVISLVTGQYSIFPLTDTEVLPFVTYSDGNREGKSTITPPEYTDSSLEYSFTLRKKDQYPYAGITCDLIQDSSFLNLTKYDFIEIEMNSDSSHTIQVFLKAFVEDFTNINDNGTHQSLLKEVSLKPGVYNYKIPLSDFAVPLWWYTANNIEEDDIGGVDFSKIISLHIQNGSSTPYDMPIRVVLKKIAFRTDFIKYIYILLAIICVYYILYISLLFILKRYKEEQNIQDGEKVTEKPIVIPYSKLDVKNDSDENMERIIETIANNYSNSDFSVNILAKEAGISASKVPGILKKEFNLNFKQYLNTIRIAESKRLLEETDNQIETVAYTVGYNNIPHFNRTFKQFVGMSPKEYRKESKSKHTENS